ncbi:hypothetical protein QBC37DRAFT_376617 [Rhypophila decipiens]|uniref:Uncharacterized protein n=1 Tax=Rhypophila decipiens TaxID=261697 RepID=A0AAN6Y294_9PEZI|nr:hypothetical protein QBC37DRAFT_376617 [Rhypophila decipiens]
MAELDEPNVVSVHRPFRLSASGRNKFHPSKADFTLTWRDAIPQTPADKAAAIVKSIATAQSEVEYDHDDYLSGLPNATKRARTRHSILADEFRTTDNLGAQTATLDDQDDELGDTSENVWNYKTFKKNFIETDEGQWMYNYTTSQLFNEVNDATRHKLREVCSQLPLPIPHQNW